MLIFGDRAKRRLRSLTTTTVDNKVRATRKQLRLNMIIPQALIIDPPDGVATVGDLISWLAGRGEEYAHAFENPKVIRAAIDRAHVKADATIGDAREVAFFPPMTGG